MRKLPLKKWLPALAIAVVLGLAVEAAASFVQKRLDPTLRIEKVVVTETLDEAGGVKVHEEWTYTGGVSGIGFVRSVWQGHISERARLFASPPLARQKGGDRLPLLLLEQPAR